MHSNGLCGILPPQIDFIFHLPEALLGPIKLPYKFAYFFLFADGDLNFKSSIFMIYIIN